LAGTTVTLIAFTLRMTTVGRVFWEFPGEIEVGTGVGSTTGVEVADAPPSSPPDTGVEVEDGGSGVSPGATGVDVAEPPWSDPGSWVGVGAGVGS